MPITWKSAGVVLGTLVAAAGIITAGYNFVVWFDDIYISTLKNYKS